MNNLEFSYNNRFAQNNKDKIYFRLFKVQVILNALIIFSYSAVTKNLLLFLPIGLNLLALYLKPNPQRIIDRTNFLFQLFFQVYIIAQSYYYLIGLTMRLYNWNLPSSIALFLVSLLVIYIPYTIVFFGRIQNTWLQLLSMFFIFEVVAMGTTDGVIDGTILSLNHFVILLNDSAFMGAIIFLLLTLVIMKHWSYPGPSMRLTKEANWKILLLLLIFCIWFVTWNAFGGSGSFLKSFFTFNFSHVTFKPQNILTGLEAGIAEELLFRYVFLTILLRAFRNHRYQIFYAAGISSLCFGLLHLTNLAAGQNLANTLNQVIFAFGMGLLMCGIYLYTKLFYIIVIFHTLLDTLVFSVSGVTMTGKVTVIDSIFTIVETILFILIAIGLLISVYNRRNRFNFG